MEWQVVYNGTAELVNVEIDERQTKPNLSEEAIAAFKEVRRHHKVSHEMAVSVNQSCLVGTPRQPGVAQFYQPIGKIVFVMPHTDGAIKKLHFFLFIATAEGTRIGAVGAKFVCHVFKCRSDSDAHALAFAAARTMATNVQRRTSLASGNEDREAAVVAWNASNPPLYHFTIGKDKTVAGNVRVMCQVDKSLKAVSKVVRLTNLIRGDELVRLLAEKFNLGSIEVSDFAVFDIRDNGDQNMLEDDDSPIDIALTWSDPCEGTFFLKKLPQGLVRLSKHSIHASDSGSENASRRDVQRHPSDASAANRTKSQEQKGLNGEIEEDSSLGPLLPYHPADEDLLLSVMITKQDGTRLGFKLTPAYLLQMCVAYAALKQGSSALRRLLAKIAKSIDTVVRNNPNNPNLLLFWAANTLKLMSAIFQDSGVFVVFNDCAKPTIDAALSFMLEQLTNLVETHGAPIDLQHARWNSPTELRALVIDYYRALDQNMSHESLREVVHRITAAMPSAPRSDSTNVRRRSGANIPLDALQRDSFEASQQEWSQFKQQRESMQSEVLDTPSQSTDTTARLGFSSKSPGSAPMASTPSDSAIPFSPANVGSPTQDVAMTSQEQQNAPARRQSSSQYDNVEQGSVSSGTHTEEQEEDIEPLPEEWEELVDSETNHRFFANHVTRQTSWTDPRDKLVTVKLVKGGKGLGLGVSGAKKTKDGRLIIGIFVSSLVPGSAADVDGTLREGDEILEVNGHSLIGVSREGAIDFLKQVRYGDTVTLLVAQESRPGQDHNRLKHTAL